MRENNQLMNNKIRPLAFTLAEVLITLGIIGVVAAITIPTLMNKVQDYQLQQAWKKKYSELNQVVNQIYADEGVTYNNNDYPGTSDTTNTQQFLCKMIKRMKVIGSGTTCVDDTNVVTNGKYYMHGGKTKNGIGIGVNGGFAANTVAFSDGSTMLFNCWNEFLVDVNGDKPPNIVGRDIYGANISRGNSPKLYLLSGTEWAGLGRCYSAAQQKDHITSANYIDDCENGTGWGCSAKVILGEQ